MLPPDHLIVATVMEWNFRESSVRDERNRPLETI
jgi:hypothetical protein